MPSSYLDWKRLGEGRGVDGSAVLAAMPASCFYLGGIFRALCREMSIMRIKPAVEAAAQRSNAHMSRRQSVGCARRALVFLGRHRSADAGPEGAADFLEQAPAARLRRPGLRNRPRARVHDPCTCDGIMPIRFTRRRWNPTSIARKKPVCGLPGAMIGNKAPKQLTDGAVAGR